MVYEDAERIDELDDDVDDDEDDLYAYDDEDDDVADGKERKDKVAVDALDNDEF